MKFSVRFLCLLTALLCLVASAPAETASGSLVTFYDAALRLLFETANVTCKGKADFSLDGARFKTADLTYIQVGYRSFQDLILLTPRANGTERESGYTIFDEEGVTTVMERYTPGVYWQKHLAASDTLMNTSVYFNQLLALGRDLMPALESSLGDQLTFSPEKTGAELKLSLTEADVPAWADSALNLFWDYGMRRFFFLDYDTVPAEGAARIMNFGTVFDGIRYLTARLSLTGANLTLRLDKQNRPASAEGTLSFRLLTRAGDAHTLEISFALSADSYGSSTVKAFRPEDYNVVRANPWGYDD